MIVRQEEKEEEEKKKEDEQNWHFAFDFLNLVKG